MKQTTESLNEKQRRFLLVFPVLILPFLTFLLWALGIVGGSEVKAAATGGLNSQLPDAKLADNKNWNKLSFYEQADKDSAKRSEAAKDDPFFQQRKDTISGLAAKGTASPAYDPLPPGYEDVNEYKVNQKLAQLNAVLNKSTVDNKPVGSDNTPQRESGFQPQEVHRLEHLLQSLNQPDTQSDPETEQLNGMMDKILAIQHPEKVSERLRLESEKNKKFVYPVVTTQNSGIASLLHKDNRTAGTENKKKNQPPKQNAFYSLSDDTTREEAQNIIEACIQQTQTLVSGATVKLSSATDVYVNGILIPKGTFIYGIATQNGERLNIAISSIHYLNNLLPVSLSVYDLDGLEGIYIPGSISRDAAKQSAGEAISNIGIASIDPSLAAQAAGAGIQAAKSLINKKVKQVKVTIKAGYRLLLHDNQE